MVFFGVFFELDIISIIFLGRYDVLDEMEPFMGGGEMIEHVYLDYFTFNEPPAKFEAGTPAVAEAIGKFLLPFSISNRVRTGSCL